MWQQILSLLIRTAQSKRVALASLALVIAFPAFAQTSHGKAEHVVLVVWDGMRPDFVTAEHTPTLQGLKHDGVDFQHHHPVYISSTEVNGTALNTGVYPEHSGIMANKEYRPGIDKTKPVAMEELDVVRRGDTIANGHYIAWPTLAEIVQRANFPTAVGGTKAVALLLDRAEDRASNASVNLFSGVTLPATAMAGLVEANEGKPFPSEITYPNVAADEWTTKALTRGLWKNGVPKLSILWMSDPDYSQHNGGPGSTEAIGALESIDRNLATVLKALDEKNVRDKTDILVVSDHGFSTVERNVDVDETLRSAGFHSSKKLKDPQPGDVLVVTLGGSVSLYVVGHDEAVIRKLAECLQTTDFAGVIFSRTAIEGTFPLDQVRVGTKDAPDLLVSMKWKGEKNSFGAPGMLTADSPKKGAHGSLSPFDMHNTLIAAGPDFRGAFADTVPTGNADLTPTILWILGIAPPQPLDGRVLVEALVGSNEPAPKSEEKAIEAKHDGEKFRWRQYLKYSTVGSAIYFNEGNGESTPK
jgi:hypothetical protein